MADKTTDDIFRRVIELAPELLDRDSLWPSKKSRDPVFRVFARAHRLGCLDELVRDRAAELLERAVIDDFDLSCLEDKGLLNLMHPVRLVALGMRVRVDMLPAVPDRVSEAVDEFDPDYYFDDVFDKFSGGIEVLEGLGDFDEATTGLIRAARDSIDRGTDRIREKVLLARKKDRAASWKDMGTVSTPKAETASHTARGSRSVFEDVDRQMAREDG